MAGDPMRRRPAAEASCGPCSSWRRIHGAVDSCLDDGEVLVAVASDRIVGHLRLVEAAGGGRSEIRNMAVDTTHRRRGVGRLLLDAAVGRERPRPADTPRGDCGDNTDNLRFYQRAGFRLRVVERDAFTPGDRLPTAHVRRRDRAS